MKKPVFPFHEPLSLLPELAMNFKTDGQSFNSLTPPSFFVINLLHSWQKIKWSKANI